MARRPAPAEAGNLRPALRMPQHPARLKCPRTPTGAPPAHRPERRAPLDRIYARSVIYTIVHIDPFQTLADPTRRRIVEALWNGERAVNDIVEAVAIHQSGVSRHLRILHQAGFVQVRADGQKRLYSLCPEPFQQLDAWVANCRGLWDARLDRFAAALKRRHNAGPRKHEETAT